MTAFLQFLKKSTNVNFPSGISELSHETWPIVLELDTYFKTTDKPGPALPKSSNQSAQPQKGFHCVPFRATFDFSSADYSATTFASVPGHTKTEVHPSVWLN